MTRRGRYAARALALIAALVLGASGCGDYSPQSPPSGIDELVIPTPSPDPGDFVGRVDNPWLPLTPGRSWSYRVTGDIEGTLTVTVDSAAHQVDGVATTSVSTTEADGTQHVDYFAQDRHGNVWWFGREGAWLAGEDGAEAGLAMPAAPRQGDGWQTALAEGVVEQRATVATTDELATTPAGRFEHSIALDLTDPLDAQRSRRVFYARGVGVVMEVSTQGPIYLAELTEAAGEPTGE